MDNKKTRQLIIDEELNIVRNNLKLLKKNDFVEAGAGAGKTHSLVDRIFYQLTREDDPCEPSEIVAITFTNKAAEELRIRIVNHLKQLDGKDDLSEDKKERIKMLLRKIDQMQISTIHKFCDNILRENAIRASLSPDYVIIMDEDEQRRINKTIRRFFVSFDKNDWEKYAFLDEFSNKTMRKNVKDNIIECFEGLITNVNHLLRNQIYFCDEFNPDFTALKREYDNALNSFAASVYDFYEAYENDFLNNTKMLKATYTDLFKNFHSYQNVDGFLIQFFALSSSLKSQNRYENPFNKTSCKKYDEFENVDVLAINYRKIRDKVELYFAKLYLEDAYHLYEEYIKDSNEDINHLSNNDLIYRTYDLLKNNPDIVIKLQNKIKHLYIDEYQDTDSLQRAIAELIAGEREDCLYLVGDPKQSIYRFRGAEPEVFFSTKKDFEDKKAINDIYDIYNLNINFRSNNYILDWVNEQYSDTGKNIRLVSDINYQYQSMLYADKNYIDEKELKDDRLVGFYSYDNSNPEEIAKLIKHVKDHYKIRRTKDRITGKTLSSPIYDEIEYKDIMLLFEGHKKMPPYVEALTKYNIPTRIFGRSDFSATLALRVFTNLFDVLNSNSNSNLALAESAFRTIYPSKYLNKNEDEAHEITSNIANILKAETKKMSAYGRAVYLIEHLNLLIKEEYDAFSFELNNISSKLYQMVEEVFSKGAKNGSELVEAFRDYLNKTIERESSIEKDVDAVMLINLHKAKGLEAPIVIWVFTQKKGNNKKSSTFYKGKFYYSEIVSKTNKVGIASNELLQIGDEEEFEKARLEYVAVTRAGEAFIFSQGAEFKAGLFNNSNRNYSQMSLPSINLSNDEEGDTNEASSQSRLYRPDNHVYQEEASSRVDIKSPSSMENKISKIREEYRLNNHEELNNDRPASNNVGTILHRALQLLISGMMDEETSTKTAINENMSLVEDEDKLYRFILTCVKAYESFFKKQGYDQYKAYPELSFSYLKDDHQIYNGSIDLLLIKGDEYIIIDYKSDEAEYIKDDDVFELTLKEKYQPQLNMYEEVVKDLFKDYRLIKKIITYFRRYDMDNEYVDVKECTL